MQLSLKKEELRRILSVEVDLHKDLSPGLSRLNSARRPSNRKCLLTATALQIF